MEAPVSSPTQERLRFPVECILEVDGKEINAFYPYLQDVQVEMSRKSATTATLTLDSLRREDGSWTVQDAGIFLPWKTLKIKACFGDTTQEVMRGFIREVRVEYPQPMHQAKVTITGQDESMLLDRAHERRALSSSAHPATDGDIARNIAREHRLTPMVEPGLSPGTLNYSGTPIRLLQQRAEANGFELFVREGSLYFRPPQLSGDPQPTIMVYGGNATNCTRFSANFDGHKPDRVTVMRAATGNDTNRQSLASNLPLMGTTPATSAHLGLPAFEWFMEQPTGATQGEVESRARAAANENAWKVQAEGELDGARLARGGAVDGASRSRVPRPEPQVGDCRVGDEIGRASCRERV